MISRCFPHAHAQSHTWLFEQVGQGLLIPDVRVVRGGVTDGMYERPYIWSAAVHDEAWRPRAGRRRRKGVMQ